MKRSPNRKLFRQRLEEMVTTIRNNIITGNILPDQLLPSERQLAKQFGLSVQSVRKGLEILVNEELIVKIPKKGSKVIDPALKGAVTIRVGYPPTIPTDVDFHQIIAMFHRDHPKIRVQAVPMGGTSFEQYKPYIDSGMLDVVIMNDRGFRQFSEKDRLNDFCILNRNDELYPFLSDAFSHNNQLYMQPFVFSPLILCYNRDHFSELGLQEPSSSWDWNKLDEYSSLLERPNERIGFRCYFSTPIRASVLLMQRGGQFERSSEGRIKLRGTKMLEAIQYSRKFYEKIPRLPNSLMDFQKQKIHMFQQGKLSMMIISYFILNQFRDSDLNYDIAPLPHFGEPMTTIIPIGIGLNKHSSNKEAASKFIDFMISRKAQSFIRKNTLSLPAHVPSAEEPITDQDAKRINRPSRFSLFREVIPSYRLISNLKIKDSEYNKLFEELRLYWAGLVDEATLCNNIEGATSLASEERG